jgi:peptide chain release factor 1
MLDKLEELEHSYDDLTRQLGDPEVLADPNQLRKTSQALSKIAEAVKLYREFKDVLERIEENGELLASIENDDDLRLLAEEERDELAERKRELEEALREELTPRDPNDDRNVVLEIRAGTGGDEASLFASDLFRMYARYAEQQRWRVEIIDISESGVKGVKEVSAIIEGKGAYSRLKYEAGVHRVQRVPETESSGRIHTSAVTVAVMPEAEDVEVQIDESEIRIDRFCSSGPGGQGVNTTYSAVRLTHLPTGIVVSCQDERSQIKNKAKALRVLKARIYEIEQKKAQDAMSAERRKMVGSGDRSEKIRTYNFPQNRVTDHRIGLTLHQLPNVLEGDLTPLIEPLVTHYRAASMAESAAQGK